MRRGGFISAWTTPLRAGLLKFEPQRAPRTQRTALERKVLEAKD
jgi:hypothetical protein